MAQRLPDMSARRPLVSALLIMAVGLLATTAYSHELASVSPSDARRGILEVTLPLLLAVGLYALGVVRLWRRCGPGRGASYGRVISFALGCIALVAALLSPVDTFSGQLFTIHMIQHEMLMLVAAPLLVLGRPIPIFLWAFSPDWRSRLGTMSRLRWFNESWSALTSPLSGWLLHAAALWGWHAPALFEAALENPRVHDLQHLTFFITALIFWTALLRGRASTNDGVSILYLFTTTVHSGVLGALITCAGHPWFGHYLETAPDWGLSALEDQQLGGLIMWVPASLVYVGAALYLLVRWIKSAGEVVASPARGIRPLQRGSAASRTRAEEPGNTLASARSSDKRPFLI
jgi:putative membrane protein